MNLAQTSTPVTYVYVTDRVRAVGFYTETLGFSVRNSGGHGDTLDMGRSLLHLTPMADHKPGPHPVVGWEVPDVVAVVEALKASGVAMTVYEGMGQDALGVWSSPDGATKLAWFPDPDGNVLMLSQH